MSPLPSGRQHCVITYGTYGTVTFLTEDVFSLSFDQYQIMLFDDRGTFVNNLSKVVYLGTLTAGI